MRTDGLPSALAVARLIALTSRMSAARAAANQAPNCLKGSEWRSARRRPWASYSWRRPVSSDIGVSSITDADRLFERNENVEGGLLSGRRYLLVPKLQLGNAIVGEALLRHLGCSCIVPDEAGASQISAFPSWSLGTRHQSRTSNGDCRSDARLIDHHDRADRNLGEEFLGGIARKTDAAMGGRIARYHS